MKYFLDFGVVGPTRVVKADGYFFDDGWVTFYRDGAWGIKKIASWKVKDVASIREHDAATD